MECSVNKTWSLIDMDRTERDVLIKTIRKSYIEMQNTHPDYVIINKILSLLNSEC